MTFKPVSGSDKIYSFTNNQINFTFGDLDDGLISFNQTTDQVDLSNTRDDSSSFPTNRLFFEKIFLYNNANITGSVEDSVISDVAINERFICSGIKKFIGT